MATASPAKLAVGDKVWWNRASGGGREKRATLAAKVLELTSAARAVLISYVDESGRTRSTRVAASSLVQRGKR